MLELIIELRFSPLRIQSSNSMIALLKELVRRRGVFEKEKKWKQLEDVQMKKNLPIKFFPSYSHTVSGIRSRYFLHLCSAHVWVRTQNSDSCSVLQLIG